MTSTGKPPLHRPVRLPKKSKPTWLERALLWFVNRRYRKQVERAKRERDPRWPNLPP